MTQCKETDLQPYIDWILNQPGGRFEHVLVVKVYDQPAEVFVPDVYEGQLTYHPWLGTPTPPQPGKPHGPNIKGILLGMASSGVGGPRVGVSIGIGHKALAISAALRFPDRRVDLKTLDCGIAGDALLMSDDVSGAFFRIELIKVNMFRWSSLNSRSVGE